MLVNGDFTQDKASWYDCANTQLTKVVNNAALEVSNNGCIYQEFPATAGKDYRMLCNALSEGTQYSSISFTMTDATYSALDAKVSVVGPGDYTGYSNTLAAPANTAIGVVTIYSEDITRVDACYVEEI